MKDYIIGLYEKAMPNNMSIGDKMTLAKQAEFDYMEISIDETDEKLSRIRSKDFLREAIRAKEISGLAIKTMCLSAHRKYPLGIGDQNPSAARKSLEIMLDAADFSAELGIRIIQLAGYDVYYEKSDEKTRANFVENLKKCVDMAAKSGIILAFETMETEFMNTVEKAMNYVRFINSPYLQIYPDIGNIRNAAENYIEDIKAGEGHIVAAHLKETKEGIFRELEYGQGRVDFKGCIKELRRQGVAMFTCEFWYDNKNAPDPLEYIKRNKKYINGRF